VEAIVQALQVLEAPTSFEPLLKPFEALIEGRLRRWATRCFSETGDGRLG
jgi:DTW domain-containing protein YfiP